MNVLIVHAHPEPRSFNAALTARAVEVLGDSGHEVLVSDLYRSGWNPVSDRRNFTTVDDAAYYRQQGEEAFAVQNDGFAPDVRAEMERLLWADTIVLQFPLWWFGAPAILKGWFDRVLAYGFAYGEGRWYDRGVFAGKRGLVSVTTGGPASMYAADGLNGAMEALLFPIQNGVLRFTGCEVLPPFVAYSADRGGDEVRTQALQAYTERLRTIESTPSLVFPSLVEYDEEFRRISA